MKLPANFKDVIDEAINIDAAKQQGISVSVIIDETAPADIVAHVRGLFGSAATHARITVGYLDADDLLPLNGVDAAVLIAGLDARIGKKAADIRAHGVPVMVVTTFADQVKLLAEESGYAIPQGDVISPELSDEDKSRAQEAFIALFGKISAPDALEMVINPDGANDACARSGAGASASTVGTGASTIGAGAGAGAAAAGARAEADAGAAAADAATSADTSAAHDPSAALDVIRAQRANVRAALQKRAKNIDIAKFLGITPGNGKKQQSLPNLLTEQRKRALNNRMGEWIIETCHDKRLSFALAFTFIARPLSLEAVNATAVQNAGIGVVVFLPGADMPVMTANQMKMVLQIAAAYGQEMTIERAKELIAVLGGAFAARSIARSAAGVVPGLGWAVKGAIGYTTTIAMGRTAIEYFEHGKGLMGITGTVVSAKNATMRAVDAALGVTREPEVSSQEKNQQTIQALKTLAQNASATGKNVFKAAGPLSKQIAVNAASSFKNGMKTILK